MFEAAPPWQGVWAATTTDDIGQGAEWRPPLSYADPSGHRTPATTSACGACAWCASLRVRSLGLTPPNPQCPEVTLRGCRTRFTCGK